MIKILFVDDEPRLRQAWQRLFAASTNIKLVGALADADELPAAVASLSPDVVVMDLSLPGRDPFAAMRDLAERHPAVRIVVYSARSDAESKRAAIDSGAWAYLDKLADAQEMFEVIEKVARGEMVIPT